MKGKSALKIFFLNRKKNSAGITMLLAIFVLAASSIISFSLGTLVIREIMASRQQSKSESVISSAEGGAETALFFQQRGLTTTGNVSVCPNTLHQDMPAFSGTISYDVCSNLYDNPYIFTSSFDNVDVVLLNNPLDPANLAASAGYENLHFSITSGDALGVQADVFDLNDPAFDPSAPFRSVSGSVPGSFSITGLDPNKSYVIFVYPCLGTPPSCTFGSVNGYVTANGGSKGIPTKNPSVDSTGKSESLIRKLRIMLSR